MLFRLWERPLRPTMVHGRGELLRKACHMADPTTPKIIVDDDWKSQARAEKEKLAAAEKQRAAEKQAAPATTGGISR